MTSELRTEQRKRTFHALDGLRGVAALAVVGRHLNDVYVTMMPGSHLAVDLFFIMSGFVLAHAYEHRIGVSLSVPAFFMLRIARLYPLYIAGSVLGLAIIGGAWAVKHGAPASLWLGSVALATAFLPAWRSASLNHFDLYPYNPPAWSLFWELVVNLLYAIVAPFLRNAALGLLIVVGTVLLVVASVRYDGLAAGSNWPTFLQGGERVLFSFFAGVAVYRVWRAGLFPRWRLPFSAIAAILLAVFVARRWFDPVWYDVVAVLLMPALVLACTEDPAPRYQALCTRLGLLSYPVYAIHGPCTFVFVAAAKRLGIEHDVLRFALETAFILAMVVAALMIERYYDRPTRAWLAARLQRRRLPLSAA